MFSKIKRPRSSSGLEKLGENSLGKFFSLDSPPKNFNGAKGLDVARVSLLPQIIRATRIVTNLHILAVQTGTKRRGFIRPHLPLFKSDV